MTSSLPIYETEDFKVKVEKEVEQLVKEDSKGETTGFSGLFGSLVGTLTSYETRESMEDAQKSRKTREDVLYSGKEVAERPEIKRAICNVLIPMVEDIKDLGKEAAAIAIAHAITPALGKALVAGHLAVLITTPVFAGVAVFILLHGGIHGFCGSHEAKTK